MKKLFISVLIGLFALTLIPQMATAQFGKNMVVRGVNWKIYETEHFEIYFDVPNWENMTRKEKEEYLGEMDYYLKTAYSQISQAIGYEMPIGKKKGEHKKPKIFIFWSRSGFQHHPLGLGGIAWAEPTKLRMACVSKEFPPEKIQQIITHEVCHLFQYSLWNLAEKSPARLSMIWRRFLSFIFEGFSQHVSGLHRTEPNTRLIIKYFLYYRVLNFLDVKDWIRYHNAYEVAYIMAGYLFDYINEHYGKYAFQNFVKEFRRARPTAQGFEKVIRQVLKTDFVELDRAFKKYLESQCEISADAKEAYEYGEDILAQRNLVPKNKPEAVYESVVSPPGEMTAAFIVRKDSVLVALISLKDGTTIKELSGGYSLYKYGLYPIVDLDGPGRALCFSQDGNSILYFAQTAGRYPTLIKINIVTGKVKKDIKEEYETTRKVRTYDPTTGIYTETEIPSVESKTVGTAFTTKLLKKKVNKIEIKLDDPESPEISSDGKTVIFSAIQNGQRDIFSLNLETKEIKNLTNDEKWNHAPSFAPDEKTIVYVVDVYGYKKLFSLDVATLQKKQLTFGASNEIRPIYSQDGKTIWFISDQDNKTKNIYSLDLENNKVAKWTNVMNGVRTVIPIIDKRALLFGAVGYRDSRHIFSDNLYQMDLDKFKPVAFADDLLKPQEIAKPEKPQIKTTDIDLEKIKKYNPWKNIYLDQAMFYGGTSNLYGWYGYGYAYLTNLDLTKHIQANIWTFGKWYKYNTFSFFDISKRLWWGTVAAFEDHYFYPWFVDWGYNPYGKPKIDEVLYNLRFKRTKLDLIAQYPLDLCHRFEFSISGQSVKYTSYIDWQGGADYYQGLPEYADWYQLRADFLKKYINDGKFATFSIGFVRDTALFKYHVGPFTNDMYRIDLSWSTGGHNITLSTEGRKYLRLGSEWVFALRGYGGIQWGKTITPWIIGDLGELRGYDWMQFMGNQILLTNFELRFPLTKNFNLLGIYLGDIRAALFMDLCKIGFDDRRFNILNEDDVNSTDTKGSLGIDFEIGTAPILGIPIHLAVSKRMKSVKLFPELEDKWQVKFYLGIKF